MTVVDPFTQRPFAGNVIPASRISAAGAAPGRPLSGAEPRRRHRQPRLVAGGPARRDPGDDQDRSPRLARSAAAAALHASAARTASCRSRRGPATCPASASASSTTATSCRRRSRGRRAACSTRPGSASTPSTARTPPQSAGADRFAALGITPPPLEAIDQGYLTAVVPGFETLGDDTNLPVRRQTRTLHLSETVGIDRGRHHAKVGGEFRALPVGRLQPPVLARPGGVHRRLHRPSGRRHAARLSDDHAARPPTTTGRRCARGRPTSTRRTTGASRRG